MATTHSHPTVQSLAHEPVPASPTLTNPDMILPYNDASPKSFRQSPPYLSLEINAPSPAPAGGLSSIPYQHGAPLSDIGEEESTIMSRTSDSGSTTPIDTASMASEQPWRMERRNSEGSVSTVSAASDLDRWKDFDTVVGASKSRPMSTSANGNLTVPQISSRRDSFTSLEGDEAESNALSERAERILANAKKRLTALEGNLSRARSSILLSPDRASMALGEHKQAGGLYRSISQSGERRLGQLGANRQRSVLSTGQPASSGHNRVFSDTSVPMNTPHSPPGNALRSVSAMDSLYTNNIGSVLQDSPQNTLGSGTNGSSPQSGSTYSAYQLSLNAVKEDDVNITPLIQSPRGLGISNSVSVDNLKTKASGIDSPDSLSRPTSQASTRELREQMNDLKSKISNLRVQAKVDSLRRRSLQNLRQPSPFTAAEGWEGKEEDDTHPARSASHTLRRMRSSERLQPLPPVQDKVIPEESDEVDQRNYAAQRTPQKPIQETIFQTPNNMYEDGNLRTPNHPQPTVAGSTYEDASEELLDENGETITASEQEQIYLNEALEESLRDGEIMEVPDAEMIEPEPERHEDRPDAFDYEHFILHSALGNYSRDRKDSNRSSRVSISSDDSVVTKRAYHSPTGQFDGGETEIEAETSTPKLKASSSRPSLRGHARNNSVESVSSISTMNTFATATEGAGSNEEDEDAVPHDILSWSGTYHANKSQTNLAQPVDHPFLRNGALPTPPTMSPRDKQPSTLPPQSLDTIINSLISYAGLSNTSQTSSALSLSRDIDPTDKELLESLFQSIGTICSDIAKQSTPSGSSISNGGSAGHPSHYDRKIWRRRLDASRMVLDGEVDIDPA